MVQKKRTAAIPFATLGPLPRYSFMKKGNEPMLSDAARASRTSSYVHAVHTPDPAFGVGRALRSIYQSPNCALPSAMQALLDRLD